ncbi:MAG TPA: hypothetical protein PKG52_11605 [bacterium]|nr:hypothetical protein [bacterium]HPS29916.1 hypothetical protein [bacterium]
MFKKVLSVFIFGMFFFSLYPAEVTDVASSADKNDPFDLNLDIQYLSTHHFGSIKREYNNYADYVYEDDNGKPYYSTEGRRVETKEYEGNPALYYMHKMLFDLEIGLYHNLSFSFGLPVVISEQYKMVMFDTVNAPDSSTLAGQQLFPWAGNLDYEHKGIGDISFGLQWAPFSQERKNVFMSWLVGINITFPTASVKTPSGMNVKSKSPDGSDIIVPSGKAQSGVGDGLFKLDFRTAASKRYSTAEPYLQLLFSLPVNSSKSIYNDPKEAFTINTGTEIYLYENKNLGQVFKLRTDIEVMYTNKGDAYNAIADARWVYDDNSLFAKLPVEDPWVQISGMLKLSAQVWKYIEFGGFAKFGYRHKHYLTNAGMGSDSYIPGLDSELTPWIGNSDQKSKSGGRLLAEEYFVLDWGFDLKVLF